MGVSENEVYPKITFLREQMHMITRWHWGCHVFRQTHFKSNQSSSLHHRLASRTVEHWERWPSLRLSNRANHSPMFTIENSPAPRKNNKYDIFPKQFYLNQTLMRLLGKVRREPQWDWYTAACLEKWWTQHCPHWKVYWGEASICHTSRRRQQEGVAEYILGFAWPCLNIYDR